MPWYPIFLVLVGLAYGNQLLDKRSFRGTNRSPTGVSTVAVNTAANIGSSFHEHLEQARNRNAMPYGALTVCCDDGMDDIVIEKTKIKRDFRVNSHDPLENTLYNNILNLQDRPTEIVFADNDVSSATTKLDAKVADVVPFAVAHFDDYYLEDRAGRDHDEVEKRVGSSSIGCDCKLRNDLLDLGQQHFPRYLLNAVCQTETANEYPQKCRRGTHCKPLEYKVKVLTFRSIRDHTQQDPALPWLPDDLRQLWKFRTVAVAAGCFCSY